MRLSEPQSKFWHWNILKGNDKNNQYYEKTGYCINYNAFNKDFGWFKNNFSFDSIINPNLDDLSIISLNNIDIASELSAGLL